MNDKIIANINVNKNSKAIRFYLSMIQISQGLKQKNLEMHYHMMNSLD